MPVAPLRNTDPTEADIVPCPNDCIPAGWSNEPSQLMEGLSLIYLGVWGIDERHPILHFEDEYSDGEKNLEFFCYDKNYYLFDQADYTVFRILNDGIGKPENWKVLEGKRFSVGICNKC